jgi:serine/threonine-protein kinase HipA
MEHGHQLPGRARVHSCRKWLKNGCASAPKVGFFSPVPKARNGNQATHAYAQLFQVIEGLKLGDGALDQAFRRMAFNVMARNCDDHTKNFSFLMKQGQPWQLAPAYDVTHAYNPKGEWTYQHLMSVNGKFDGITREDLLEEADRFMVRRPKDLLTDVRAAIENWPSVAKEAGLRDATRDRVAADFRLV